MTQNSSNFISCVEYVVQPGDTLWAIAQKAYGNGNEWTAIYSRNKDIIGDNPNVLTPGETFLVPGRYVVQSGDTLSSIAEQVFGPSDDATWQNLYEQNKDTIGSDPNRIYPGQVLYFVTSGWGGIGAHGGGSNG